MLRANALRFLNPNIGAFELPHPLSLPPRRSAAFEAEFQLIKKFRALYAAAAAAI
jgi:hypothetical protein